MEDMISRQALCEYALNQKDKSITPNDIMRFPSAQLEPTTHGSIYVEMTEKQGDRTTDGLISRKAAIDALNVGAELLRRVLDDADIVGAERAKYEWGLGLIESYISDMKELPPAQPETHDKRTKTHSCDCISRQTAMEEISKQQTYKMFDGEDTLYLDANDVGSVLASLPSAQPMLYGYDIEHLKLIANVMQKENLPPERVTEALMDIGRIVAIVRDEFEETLRKAVEQCMT